MTRLFVFFPLKSLPVLQPVHGAEWKLFVQLVLSLLQQLVFDFVTRGERVC